MDFWQEVITLENRSIDRPSHSLLASFWMSSPRSHKISLLMDQSFWKMQLDKPKPPPNFDPPTIQAREKWIEIARKIWSEESNKTGYICQIFEHFRFFCNFF